MQDSKALNKNAGFVHGPAFGECPKELQREGRESLNQRWRGGESGDVGVKKLLKEGWEFFTDIYNSTKSHVVFQTDERLSILELVLRLSQSGKEHENKKQAVAVANCDSHEDLEIKVRKWSVIGIIASAEVVYRQPGISQIAFHTSFFPWQKGNPDDKSLMLLLTEEMGGWKENRMGINTLSQ